MFVNLRQSNMTSETDVKTNEFLRRRKIRLQQVREQSKNIARKIRERANAEKLQFTADTDIKKEQEYLKHQTNLIKRLQEYYHRGLENLGDGHKNVSQVDLRDNSLKPLDKSKVRGKEAVAELRRRRQEKLDEQKKALDRKLQAREEANEISREKSLNVANKLSNKKQDIQHSDVPINTDVINDENDCAIDNNDKNSNENTQHVKDMSTQWDLDAVPSGWDPDVPTLNLPKNDGPPQDNSNELLFRAEKPNKLDLFALSNEMPSSLRGGLTNIPTVNNRPSTLVSEYLQSRNLNLRQPGPLISSKRAVNDLPRLKQTILRTRTTAASGVCVLDEQLVPTPVWHPVKNCTFCSNDKKITETQTPIGNKKLSITSSELNKIYSSIFSSRLQSAKQPSWVPHKASPCRRTKTLNDNYLTQSSKQTRTSDHNLGRKQSVTVYNHHTKDTQQLPCDNGRLVVRDNQSQEDAYSLASKINTSQPKEDPNKQGVQNMRNRVAVSKLHVEKEYKETLGFLKKLQKSKSPKMVIKNAYRNDEQQQEQTSKQQQKLEYEFKKIENECRRKHKCKKSSLSNRSATKSPIRTNLEEDEKDNDFQYSWMPVPDSDETLAVHTIPTGLRESRVGNSVKFTNIDGYHEYRSRHKHTPPTKDVGLCKQRKTIIIDNKESSSSIIDSSSAENTVLPSTHKNKKVPEPKIDSEHIVIYKVSQNTKHAKHERKQKLIDDIIKALREEKNKECLKEIGHQDECSDLKTLSNKREQKISFQSPEEDVYKAVCENGASFNVVSYSNLQIWNAQGGKKSWWDSVSNCVVDLKENGMLSGQEGSIPPSSNICKNNSGHSKYAQAQWDIENKNEGTDPRCTACKCGKCPSRHQVSACTSAASFETAAQVIANDIGLMNERFTKLIDDKGKENEKLYVGASGLLKDDAYEVVIQLRKKDCSNSKKESIEIIKDKTNVSREIQITEKQVASVSHEKQNNLEPPSSFTVSNDEKNTDTCINRASEPQPKLVTKDSLELKDKVIDEVLCNPTSSQKPAVKSNIVDNRSNPESDNLMERKWSDEQVDLKTACTQTSFFSPIQKPTPVQMSSSASTSYMSPPESILPRYLRNNLCSGDQEHHHNARFEQSPDYGRLNCQCLHCQHGKPGVTQVHYQMQTDHKLETPSTKSFITEQEAPCTDTISSRETRDKHKCHRRHSRKKLVTVHINNKSPYLSSKKGHGTASLSTNSKLNKKKKDFEVNPTVINYVDKLLSLNKESLKAIEIVNQDCSSINTPGSSVIDTPNNFDRNNANLQKKISLHQIKEDIIRQLVAKINEQAKTDAKNINYAKESEVHCKVNAIKISKRKQAHKVKSLKVSKKLVKKSSDVNSPPAVRFVSPIKTPTAKKTFKKPFERKVICCNMEMEKPVNNSDNPCIFAKPNNSHNIKNTKASGHNVDRNVKSVHSSYSSLPTAVKHYENEGNPTLTVESSIPINIATQTNQINNEEINFIKVAESKLENMEKIADLTEICTMRLSNLAKVLEEVRKNKSVVYSRISTPDTNSEYEQKDVGIDIHVGSVSPTKLVPAGDSNTETSKKNDTILSNASYPRPMNIEQYSVANNHPAITIEQICSKVKGRPPPVLEMSKLKDCQDNIVPHELSTVPEVDSPSSGKLKNISSHSPHLLANNGKVECNEDRSQICSIDMKPVSQNKKDNPDLLQDGKKIGKSYHDSSEHSRAQMIDLNQFNKIMLQPFLSINDYAKDFKTLSVEETSNIDDVHKADVIVDDMSSLHSEGSLPDVVSELLKRNIISEPFKFDSGNSTTISSDSTLPMLALSKQKKEQKKVITFHNKENLGDTSDTLSISSNPDLEQAFKKIGMGWASSTLKKTKERLALSSSSNTSSSSISHIRTKNSNSKDIPVLVTDSLTSAIKDSKKNNIKYSKTFQQQTSFSNSMTVKDFLTNELAKRITFASASNRSEGDEEFVSLCETKIPEEMKRLMTTRADHSSDQSHNNGNRARTSTPVQIFKSMTYHSSSNSNSSNALFSNVDELSSVKGSLRNNSTSDHDNLTIPNLSLKIKKSSECSKSD